MMPEMDALSVNNQHFLNRTRLAYVATRVLDTPFWAIYNLLPVILYKDLHATPAQIAAMVSLRPLVSLLSMYWSSAANKRSDRLVPSIVWARVLGYCPFFFFPFVDNCWFFVFAFGLYMMLTVGVLPAWMELLKVNIPDRTRERVFSYTQAFGYLGGGLLPFAFGWLLDGYAQSWRWLFPLASMLALGAFFFQRRIRVRVEEPFATDVPILLVSRLVDPWKGAWELMRRRVDYRRFQVGFMIVGCGLMIIAPALPIFLVDGLYLSYTELAVAIMICKGIGFTVASPFWSRWIHRLDIFRFTAYIAAAGCLFPLCLLIAPTGLEWLYAGYVCYGIMQSGSELVWSMSGPLFAKEENSSVYTGVNIIAIGLRGCFIPALGSFLCVAYGASVVMLLSIGCFVLAAIVLRFNERRPRAHQATASF